MGRKIFVSYKYGDTQVKSIKEGFLEETRVRDYVDLIQEIISKEDVYKGESDDEDLSDFKDGTIESKIKEKIFDSSVTVVVISKGMKEVFVSESDQWIPWEVAYSLREQSRKGRTSRPNGALMLVLPDENGSYEYYIKENTCAKCNCRILMTGFLFGILRDNTFNQKYKVESDCNQHEGNPVYVGDSSYISSVKWDDFLENPTKYIDKAAEIRDRIDEYNIVKKIG